MSRPAMTCCVCGANAGRWEQHSNRDTGFGICRACVDWVSGPSRGEHRSSPAEMDDLYGIPGVNYEPRYHVVYGREFVIRAEFPETDEGIKASNAYMEANPDVGCLAVVDGRVILAGLEDKGRA